MFTPLSWSRLDSTEGSRSALTHVLALSGTAKLSGETLTDPRVGRGDRPGGARAHGSRPPGGVLARGLFIRSPIKYVLTPHQGQGVVLDSCLRRAGAGGCKGRTDGCSRSSLTSRCFEFGGGGEEISTGITTSQQGMMRGLTFTESSRKHQETMKATKIHLHCSEANKQNTHTHTHNTKQLTCSVRTQSVQGLTRKNLRYET